MCDLNLTWGGGEVCRKLIDYNKMRGIDEEGVRSIALKHAKATPSMLKVRPIFVLFYTSFCKRLRKRRKHTRGKKVSYSKTWQTYVSKHKIH